MKKIKDTWITFWRWFGRFLFSSKVVKYVAIAFIAAGVICIGIGLYTHFGELEDVTPLSLTQHTKQKNDALETVLTKWIYDHSKTISRRTARWIAIESIKTNKPLFIVALIAVESEHVPTATGRMTTYGEAKGLTQVMWKVWGVDLIKAGIAKEERDLYDVDISIKSGNFILDKCLVGANGDITKTLERYLGGKDGYYKNRITEHLANLYILTSSL